LSVIHRNDLIECPYPQQVGKNRLHRLRYDAKLFQESVFRLLLQQQYSQIPTHITADTFMIDRLECEQNMANPHIPANRALRYTQIYDAILHAHISLEHRYIPWKSLVWTRVVTDTLLPPALL
jgi:hypothetical protein